MKITDVRTILLTGPYSNDPYICASRPRRSAAFIEIHTDGGLTGWGETYAGYFFPESVPGVVEFFKPILVGQSPDDVEVLWQRMYRCGNYWCRVGLGVAIMNGIEAALWDLRGKMHGVPVHQLLGGCKHARLPCYASGGPSNYPKDQLAAKLDFYLGLGFRGVKIATGSLTKGRGWHMPLDPKEAADFEADKLTFARAHVGKDVRLMLDGHMGNNPDTTWSLGTARAVMKAVEPFNLFFFEEPLHYTDPWGYAELCRETTVPIAGGEVLTAAYEWRVFAEANAFDIGQPDAAYTGGLGEFMRVAAMMEKRGRKVATHAAGAGGALMQNLHCGFACANTVICEILPALGGIHLDIARDFHFENGDVLPPQLPGLGITLTDDIKNRYPFVPGSGEFNSVPGKVLVD
ncbi:MAG: mandelate racemase/muconate lactonizing enzyme family protein [Verrucomicrobia bacterium]|nr:mandelate racemase/muconate lactonizing enzyme family protein [Verrucomicrobiota bacterium]